MLQGLFILLTCQLVGEGLAHGFGLPVPGPVIGILLLLGGLALRARLSRPDPGATGAGSSARRTSASGTADPPDPAAADAPVSIAADGLLRNMGLLFVPAGAGIVQSLPLVLGHGAAVVVALVGSTVITLIATVATFRLVSRWQAPPPDAGDAA